MAAEIACLTLFLSLFTERKDLVEQQAWLSLAQLVPEVMVVELMRYDVSDPLLICYRYSHTLLVSVC